MYESPPIPCLDKNPWPAGDAVFGFRAVAAVASASGPVLLEVIWVWSSRVAVAVELIEGLGCGLEGGVGCGGVVVDEEFFGLRCWWGGGAGVGGLFGGGVVVVFMPAGRCMFCPAFC